MVVAGQMERSERKSVKYLGALETYYRHHRRRHHRHPNLQRRLLDWK